MIELRHLRYFVAVAKELNFRRAAERVHINQTPLSRTIRDLEEQLGVLLFVRAPRKLHLTPAGLRLLKEARKVLIRIEHAQRAVRETDTRFRAPLRIGVADGIAQPRLSECLARWQDVAPEIPLDLTDMRADELAAALRREEIDAGFSFGLPDADAIAQEPAWTYPVMALLPLRHELASYPALPSHQSAGFPVDVATPTGSQACCSRCKPSCCATRLRPLSRGSLYATGHFSRVAAGTGVGLADSGHIATLGRADVTAVPLVEEERITTYVLYKYQRLGLPESLQRFVAHAKTLH